jgi:DNA-binding transcriptional LysR family regulator
MTLVLSPGRSDDATIRAVSVGEERFACLLRRDHPAADRLDLDTYCALPHLLVAPGGTAGGYVDTVLERLGRRRRVAVRTRHFLTAPELIRGTDLIVTLPARFAAQVAPRHDLVVRPPPIDLPPFHLHLSWHERWHHDAGHRWIRQLLAEGIRAQLPVDPRGDTT